MPIHPTALVHSQANIDASADIGPYCTVGPHVRIGAHTRLISHVVVENHTTLGDHNVVHPFAVLGGTPQDLKYRNEPTQLLIGNHNTIREGASLNIGTEGGRHETRVGNHCLLMAYAHVAHDCVLGNGVIMANSVGLAGHVDIADHAILGGLVGVHQYCRIGRYAFAGGGAIIVQDVPPFALVYGDRARIMGVNVVGLRRAGWPKEQVRLVHQAYRCIFQQPEITRAAALNACEQELTRRCAAVQELCDFIGQAKQRGICPAKPDAFKADNAGDE